MILTKLECCKLHQMTYPVGEDFWAACPKCVPQPTPLGIRLSDPTEFFGPEWVYVASIGPRGRWMPLKNYVLVAREQAEKLLGQLKEEQRAHARTAAQLANAELRIEQLEGRS